MPYSNARPVRASRDMSAVGFAPLVAASLRRVGRMSSSRTEDYVRHSMRPAVRRQFQPIALRVLAEAGGAVEIDRIRRAILARHPTLKWDRRYPLRVLSNNGIIDVDQTTARFVEDLDTTQIASLLSALDERAVRTTGLRVEDSSWRSDGPEWARLRVRVVDRDGEVCAVLGCGRVDELELDHVWRGSLLAAAGWSPSAINSPINLQLLCGPHHKAKTADEARLLSLQPSDPNAD